MAWVKTQRLGMREKLYTVEFREVESDQILELLVCQELGSYP